MTPDLGADSAKLHSCPMRTAEIRPATADAGFRRDFTPIYWAYATGFPKAASMSRAVMKRLGDCGELVGTETIDAGMQGGSMHAGRVTQLVERDVQRPTNPHAQALGGAYGGFQPQPAMEVIIVAMKPLSERMFVAQALKNGKGIT